MVEDNEDIKTGYNIRFKFIDNPYFTDSELVKTVRFAEGSQIHFSSTAPQVSPLHLPSGFRDLHG